MSPLYVELIDEHRRTKAVTTDKVEDVELGECGCDEYILASRFTLMQRGNETCSCHEAFHEICTATARCRFTPVAAILAWTKHVRRGSQ